MEKEERKKSFLEFDRGAILERFDYELERVIDNILDVNTPANKPRKISLTVTLKPDADRQILGHEIAVKSTLQPTNPMVSASAIVHSSGKVSLVEMTPQIPGQMDVEGKEQRQPNVIEFNRRMA